MITSIDDEAKMIINKDICDKLPPNVKQTSNSSSSYLKLFEVIPA